MVYVIVRKMYGTKLRFVWSCALYMTFEHILFFFCCHIPLRVIIVVLHIEKSF